MAPKPKKGKEDSLPPPPNGVNEGIDHSTEGINPSSEVAVLLALLSPGTIAETLVTSLGVVLVDEVDER